MTELLTELALDMYYHDHCLQDVIGAKSSYYHVIQHLKKHFGSMATNVITAADVKQYCQKRKEGKIGKSASNGTLNRELNMLLTAIRFAADHLSYNYKDVVPNILKSFPKASPCRKVWLSLDEMYYMLSLAKKHKFNNEEPSRIYRFCMAGFYCGQRRDAILQLRPKEQIDLKRRLIDFNPPGREQTTKNRPIVPIADELMPLAEEIVHNGDDFWCIHPGSIRTNFEDLVEKCKFNKHVTPHVMRHTYATQALQNGVTIWEVAGVLGDDPETVKEHYGHHCPEYLRGAVNFRAKNAY